MLTQLSQLEDIDKCENPDQHPNFAPTNKVPEYRTKATSDDISYIKRVYDQAGWPERSSDNQMKRKPVFEQECDQVS